MIIIKNENVKLKAISPALAYMFYQLSNLNSRMVDDFPKDFIITSINDGKHLSNSQHYKDTAFDMRSKNFKSPSSKMYFVDYMTRILGEKFIILFENVGTPNEHFHFQIKKGQEYP